MDQLRTFAVDGLPRLVTSIAILVVGWIVALALGAVGRAALQRTRLDDKIAVKAPQLVTEKVRKAIEQALERRAEREARRIRVDVQDGTVTLTGAVHSWAERKSLVAAARFTPGVREVEDHLRIQPV